MERRLDCPHPNLPPRTGEGTQGYAEVSAAGCRWQAAWWPGRTSTSGGSTTSHLPAIATGQRGWKRQPAGGSVGLGGSPGITGRWRSRLAGSGSGMARISALCDRVSAADGYAWLRRQLEKAGTENVDPVLVHRMDKAEPIASAELLSILEQLDRIRGEMLAFMDGCDLILSPTGSTPALPHGDANRDDYPDAIYTRPYNVTGWPGCVVRAGTSPEGLPIGVQLGAVSWREDIVLAAAAAVESGLGGWRAPTLPL